MAHHSNNSPTTLMSSKLRPIRPRLLALLAVAAVLSACGSAPTAYFPGPQTATTSQAGCAIDCTPIPRPDQPEVDPRLAVRGP